MPEIGPLQAGRQIKEARAAFHRGFLARCAEEGLGADAVVDRVKQAEALMAEGCLRLGSGGVEKRAFPGATLLASLAAYAAGLGYGTGKGAVKATSSMLPWVLGGGLGVSAGTGYFGGKALAHLRSLGEPRPMTNKDIRNEEITAMLEAQTKALEGGRRNSSDKE